MSRLSTFRKVDRISALGQWSLVDPAITFRKVDRISALGQWSLVDPAICQGRCSRCLPATMARAAARCAWCVMFGHAIGLLVDVVGRSKGSTDGPTCLELWIRKIERRGR